MLSSMNEVDLLCQSEIAENERPDSSEGEAVQCAEVQPPAGLALCRRRASTLGDDLFPCACRSMSSNNCGAYLNRPDHCAWFHSI
jgi:hypothetical protein